MRRSVIACSMMLGLAACMPARAGIYTDDLTKCLVGAASPDDRIGFMRWMFSALALHPAVKQYASISDDERAAINKKVGMLFTRLMTVDCRKQTGLAIRYEGTSAIENSFKVFGEVAGRDLFSDPNVAKGLQGVEENFDQNELKKVIEEADKAPAQ